MLLLYALKKKKQPSRDFSGGSVFKNPPSEAGDVGLIPGWGDKIPHTTGQLSPPAVTRESFSSVQSLSRALQWGSLVAQMVKNLPAMQ